MTGISQGHSNENWKNCVKFVIWTARDNFRLMHSERRSDLLRNQLQPAIRRKHRVFLSSGMCLQLDNARPHPAVRTVKQIQDLKLEVLHHTPY